MQTTFIYGLECPITKEIRYIGKSNNPKTGLNNIYMKLLDRKTIIPIKLNGLNF